MSQPKLAAQLYTVREFTKTAADLAATLKKVRAIGYTSVQISAIGPIPDAEVKQMLDDNALTVCITHTSYDNLWKNIDAVIAQHKLWNCPNVALGAMPAPYREGGEAAFHKFAAEANQVGEKLAKAGLTFSYHNHSFELVRFGKLTGLDIIYNETDSRYLQAEIDTYWVQHGGGDPIAWIKRMKNRMPVVHFKDMVIFEGKQTMAEIGEGNLNWPGIISACEEANVRWYAIEQDICQRDPFESLKISFENLKVMGLS
jgi:sugar phosphate isomerase/epimerase